jgi:hypothetical protein
VRFYFLLYVVSGGMKRIRTQRKAHETNSIITNRRNATTNDNTHQQRLLSLTDINTLLVEQTSGLQTTDPRTRLSCNGTFPRPLHLLGFLCPTAHPALFSDKTSELPIATVRQSAGKRSLDLK